MTVRKKIGGGGGGELGCWTVTVGKMTELHCDCEENEGGEGGLCKL